MNSLSQFIDVQNCGYRCALYLGHVVRKNQAVQAVVLGELVCEGDVATDFSFAFDDGSEIGDKVVSAEQVLVWRLVEHPPLPEAVVQVDRPPVAIVDFECLSSLSGVAEGRVRKLNQLELAYLVALACLIRLYLQFDLRWLSQST